MNIVTIEEQTFKQVCGRCSGFVSQVERICKENTHQPEKWLSGREVCALLGISIRSLQNYRDSGKLGYSQIGNKLYVYHITYNGAIQYPCIMLCRSDIGMSQNLRYIFH